MRALFDALVFVGITMFVAGCAGVGSTGGSDPAAKLRDAGNLLDRQGRPMAAENLIQEAVAAYQATGDRLGLANAYRTYGFFFRSSAIEGQWSEHYRNAGFLDRGAQFDSRYARSIEYFEKARAIFADFNRYDALTTVNLNIGFTYEVMGYRAAACEAFDLSLQNSRDNFNQADKAKLSLPQGFATYEEFLAPHLERAGCIGRHNRPVRRNPLQAA